MMILAFLSSKRRREKRQSGNSQDPNSRGKQPPIKPVVNSAKNKYDQKKMGSKPYLYEAEYEIYQQPVQRSSLDQSNNCTPEKHGHYGNHNHHGHHDHSSHNNHHSHHGGHSSFFGYSSSSHNTHDHGHHSSSHHSFGHHDGGTVSHHVDTSSSSADISC